MRCHLEETRWRCGPVDVSQKRYGITRVNQGVHSQGCIVPGKLGLEVVRRLCSGCISSAQCMKKESVIKIHQAYELALK